LVTLRIQDAALFHGRTLVSRVPTRCINMKTYPLVGWLLYKLLLQTQPTFLP